MLQALPNTDFPGRSIMQKRNYQDGGEAIVEAFRNLGVDYKIGRAHV